MDIAPPLRPEPIRPGLALPDGGTETLAHARIRFETVGLAVLLAGTAVLYLWNLAASGWANAYYSAAALAGSQDWTAWFFGSFDAGNALTVDKTPAAMWVMGLSVRLFGLSPWSVLAPQAIMGVAAVAILYATVRRAVGPLGAFVGAAAFALTPVAALMFRFNNPDALLVLLLVVAAYCTIRGIEVGRRGGSSLPGSPSALRSWPRCCRPIRHPGAGYGGAHRVAGLVAAARGPGRPRPPSPSS